MLGGGGIGCRFQRGVAGIGPFRSLIDPGPQKADLGGCQRVSGRRHEHLDLIACHQVNQPAARRVARQKRRAGVTSRKCIDLAVQPQSVERVGRAVAYVAAPFKQGLDLADVVDLAARRWWQFGGRKDSRRRDR